MGPEVVNKNKNCVFNGPYAGRDLYITMFQESEREFVVTHNANIKPAAYFTGRETELQDLRQRIEEGRKSVLVSGMGGIGKTHICRKLFEEYLNKHAEDKSGPFRHLGYIEYNGDMGSSLQNCLKFKQQESPEQNQEAAWRELEYLASDGKLLLFVDNVDKPISADLGLQRLKGIPGAVVLTSRQVSFGDEFEAYQIGFLDMGQCKEIYEKIRFRGSGRKVDPEEVPDLEYVIENMAGRHTITVELMAHLARTKLWAVKRLREELEQKGFRLEFHKDGELVNIQESYEKLYGLSGLTEAEQNILEAFSVFPYIPLAAETCNEWLLTDAGVSENDDILMGLYQKGWLQFDTKQESYALHPVFAQFICGKCKPEAQKHMELIEACQKSFSALANGLALGCRYYIEFAESIYAKMDMGMELRAYLICALASILEYMAEYKRAEELFRKGLQICENAFGWNHPNTAAVYNNLAYVYFKQGKYEKAEKLYQRGLQINKWAFGEEHPDVATNYDNLANVYSERGEYEKAEVLYKSGLKIREKVLGERHPDTAISHNNLAVLFDRQGRYIEAERMYRKSLQISELVLGEDHLDVAVCCNNLAGVHKKKGEYEEAERLYEKSLKLRERILGKEHPDTAICYCNLAGVCAAKGKYMEAEMLYKKSLQIWERTLGGAHPFIATCYNELAWVYRAQENYAEAKRLYEKSLQLSEEILGKKHPDVAVDYNNLAKLCEMQGKYMEAEELYKKGIQIWREAFGEEHPFMAVGYNNLAALYEIQGMYKEAEELCGKSLRIKEELLGDGHLDTAISYENLAVVYGEQGKYKEAEKLCKKSLLIRIRMQGEEHPDTAVNYSNLAKIYYYTKEYERALDCIFRAYKTFEVSFGEKDFRTKNCRKNMKAIYFAYEPESGFKQWIEEKMKE